MSLFTAKDGVIGISDDLRFGGSADDILIAFYGEITWHSAEPALVFQNPWLAVHHSGDTAISGSEVYSDYFRHFFTLILSRLFYLYSLFL